MIQKNRYEQPELKLVSLAANDILLTSTDADDPNGELSNDYTVNLGKLLWNDVWN